MKKKQERQDRLTQIWGGFSSRTALDVSGANIEATPRPSARHYGEDVPVDPFLKSPIRATEMAGESGDPVAAALSAMKAQMSASAEAHKGGRGRKGQAAEASYANSRPIAPPTSSVERQILADIEFTRSKVERDGGDYITFAAARQEEWERNKRKKRFFGLF